MYKVMIVDDREVARAELKRLKLWGKSSGFTISEEAQNGQDALNKLGQNPVDLVITDIKMPKVDGIELLRAIVEQHLCSCVVLLSDYSEFQYARQGIVLGAFDYIPKPVNADELSCVLSRAKALLDNERLEQGRIKKLEEAQKDQELRLTMDEVNALISLIRNGDEQSLLGITQFMDRIMESFPEGELHRTASLYRNILCDITEELRKVYPMLTLFLDSSGYDSFQDGKYQKSAILYRMFMNRVRSLSYLITTLKLNFQDKGIVKQVCQFIFQNIDNNISLSLAADRLYMNKTYISESFKQKIGISFTEYVTLVKMERAKVFLRDGELKTYEIAEKLGYKDTEYFSRLFKKAVGVTPTEFRSQYEEDALIP